MKKILILLASLFLLVSCMESVAIFGGGAANGKLTQSSLNAAASYGVKQKTGKTPLQHAFAYGKEKKILEKKEDCSSFIDKKDLEICLMFKKKTRSKKVELKEKKFLDKPLKEPLSSLRSSINNKSKIKYLD